MRCIRGRRAVVILSLSVVGCGQAGPDEHLQLEQQGFAGRTGSGGAGDQARRPSWRRRTQPW